MADEPQFNSVGLAAELTIAWLGNQNVRVLAEDVPVFLKSMHGTIQELSGSTEPTPVGPETGEQSAEYAPAVSVRKSLASKEHIISLIDGKPYRTLRRHLAGHGLTPEQYRERYNLKADYPMTAPSYSEARRAMAIKVGLGAKRGASRATVTQEKTDNKPASRKRGRSGSPKVARKTRANHGRRAAAEVVDTAPATTARKIRNSRKAEAPAS